MAAERVAPKAEGRRQGCPMRTQVGAFSRSLDRLPDASKEVAHNSSREAAGGTAALHPVL